MGILRSWLAKADGAAAAIVLLLLTLAAPRADGQEIAREYALKAGFLYHFCEFIDWPPTSFRSKDSPLIIGVLGDNPFGSFLGETVRGEMIRGRRIQLEHYGRADEVRNCHILFVSASEQSRLSSILGQLHGRSVVTVGESDDFISQGGMIALNAVHNRIKLRVNLAAVRGAGISMSSKLLRVADIAKS